MKKKKIIKREDFIVIPSELSAQKRYDLSNSIGKFFNFPKELLKQDNYHIFNYVPQEIILQGLFQECIRNNKPLWGLFLKEYYYNPNARPGEGKGVFGFFMRTLVIEQCSLINFEEYEIPLRGISNGLPLFETEVHNHFKF